MITDTKSLKRRRATLLFLRISLVHPDRQTTTFLVILRSRNRKGIKERATRKRKTLIRRFQSTLNRDMMKDGEEILPTEGGLQAVPDGTVHRHLNYFTRAVESENTHRSIHIGAQGAQEGLRIEVDHHRGMAIHTCEDPHIMNILPIQGGVHFRPMAILLAETGDHRHMTIITQEGGQTMPHPIIKSHHPFKEHPQDTHHTGAVLTTGEEEHHHPSTATGMIIQGGVHHHAIAKDKRSEMKVLHITKERQHPLKSQKKQLMKNLNTKVRSQSPAKKSQQLKRANQSTAKRTDIMKPRMCQRIIKQRLLDKNLRHLLLHQCKMK